MQVFGRGVRVLAAAAGAGALALASTTAAPSAAGAVVRAGAVTFTVPEQVCEVSPQFCDACERYQDDCRATTTTSTTTTSTTTTTTAPTTTTTGVATATTAPATTTTTAAVLGVVVVGAPVIPPFPQAEPEPEVLPAELARTGSDSAVLGSIVAGGALAALGAVLLRLRRQGD